MTSTKTKIVLNTIYQIVGRFSTSLSTLIATAMITRYLGLKSFGEYSIVIAFLTVFYTLSDFGVNSVLIREFAEDKYYAKKNFKKVLSLRIVIGVLLVLLAAIIVFFMPYKSGIKLAVYIGLPLLIFNSISKAASLIFQSFLQYKYQSISMGVGAFFSVILIAFAVLSPIHSLPLVIFATVIGSSISPLISMYYAREYLFSDSKYIDFGYWKKILLDSLPFGISLVLNTFMIQADRILLSVISSEESVGIYSLAYRIFELVLILPTFIMNATFPVLVVLRKRDVLKYRKSIYTLLRFMILVSIGTTLIATYFSHFLVPLIWGSEMANSATPFNILMYGSVFFFVSAPLSWIMLAEGKDRFLPYIYGFGFLINLVLNLFFIPIYDYVGAAYITIITEGLIVVFLILSILSYNRKKTMSHGDKG